jgi:hypothetical protein
MGLERPAMTQSTIDSLCNSVQAIRPLTMTAGSVVLDSNNGDFNKDGFCEKEGAYVLRTDNNSVNFTLPAQSDTCRFYPAFRLTNYLAADVPQYVFVNSRPQLKDYNYNVFHKKSTNELIIQFNSVFCSPTDIFISPDRTLAVEMSEFMALPGDGCDTLRWITESEDENLGFVIYRRIDPWFLDSLAQHTDSSAADTLLSPAGALYKKRKISVVDTAWLRLNEKVVPGAKSGVSYSRRVYQKIDFTVHNGVRYQYKLVAMDLRGSTKTYGPVSATPGFVLPTMFALMANFPNPFKQITYIRFALPTQSKVDLTVYDLSGRTVCKLIAPERIYKPGYYKVAWNGRDTYGRSVATGPYIYRLVASRYAKAQIMILTR